MKKIFLSVFFLVAVFFPGKIWAAERISSLDVEFQVNQDASVDVSEEIRYDFDEEKKHGIFRNIPVKYQARGGNYSLRLSDISVTDENGNSYNFSKEHSGGDVVLKIGDADKFVTGQKTYVIRYKVKRALNYFEDHDEFYWNAIGDGWEIPIQNIKARVILPEGVSDARMDCFVGHYGSVENCSHDSSKNVANFFVRDLSPSEGFTVVAGFPKGTVFEPSQSQKVMGILRDNKIILFPVIVFLVMFFLWRAKGRDPKGRETIIAQFDVPDDLAPMEVGTLVDEKAQNKDLSAQIIHLAIRGYLKIRRIETGMIFKGKDFELTKLKDEGGLENEFDRELMVGIFENSIVGEKVKISDLKNKFNKHVSDISSAAYSSLVKKGYFSRNPKLIRGVYVGVAAAVAFFGVFFGSFLGFIGTVSCIVSGLILFIFSFLMPRKTKKGVLVKEHALGLKLYMTVAEKDRMEFHNAPEKDFNHFEKLLPFAMVLGVTEQWAKQFKDIFEEDPNWYSSGAAGGFFAMDLANDMNSLSTSTKSASSQASSGGSGFSGGGSGGGFGGGGGGSW
ncbi:DUF2207 domain-containing protein [Patescibacteria group bacterium]